MIRNLKILGLTAVAAFAMSAMFASAAQGEFFFTAGQTPGTHTASIIHGEQYGEGNVFETANATVECQIATGTGETDTGTETEVPVVIPQVKDCQSGGLPVTVTYNGCNHDLGEKSTLETGVYTAKVDLVCPVGKVLEVEIYLSGTMTAHNTKVCTVTVPPVKGLSHAIARASVNAKTGKDDITVEVNVSGISYEEHGSFCPDGNTVKRSDGRLTGKGTVTGESAGGVPHDIWNSDTP